MRLLMVMLCLFAGCKRSNDPCELEELGNGVFGVIEFNCRVTNCETHGYGGVDVTAHESVSGPALATAVTEDDGFYELELPSGQYMLCMSPPNTSEPPSCTMIAVDGAPVRYDWKVGRSFADDHWEMVTCR